MASQSGSSKRRGYVSFREVADCPSSPFDYYSSKAVFLGEDSQMVSVLQNYLHIDVSSAPGVESSRMLPLSDEVAQSFQNQLLFYRIRSLPAVFRSQFDVSALLPEAVAIAAALGRCIVDAPELQAELVTLLTPFSDQQLAERVDDLGSLAVGAELKLCREGKEQALVGKIASEVNRIQKERGERLQYSPHERGRLSAEVSHPWHKNKNVPWIGPSICGAPDLVHCRRNSPNASWVAPDQRQRKPPLPIVR